MGNPNDDNHANQMNPEHDAYWQSRGDDERPEDWEERLDDEDYGPGRSNLTIYRPDQFRP